MELLPTGSLRKDPTAKIFRHSPLGSFVACLVAFGLLGAWGLALLRVASEIPPLFWIVLGPMAGIAGLILLVVATTLFGSFLASLRSTNWFARVDRSGVHLNLRSYRNAHFEDGEATVVQLGLGEVESVGRVVETRRELRGTTRTTIRQATIELRLGSRETGALAEAVRAERQREAPMRIVLGLGSSTKHHHVPVFVPEPGVVRVEWNKALFRALAEHVVDVPERRVDLDRELPEEDAEERARALALRGERMAALRILREGLGLSTEAAKQWLRDEGDQAA